MSSRNNNITNNNNIQIPYDQFINIQQRLSQLEQNLNQNQTTTESQDNINNTESMNQLSALHSLDIRPSYTWNPHPALVDFLSLDKSLFTSPMISDEKRKRIIEKYPMIDALQYQPPDTIPEAARKMNKSQSRQDMSLKRLQYLLSGVVRPLDVLSHEISEDIDNDKSQRCLNILNDCRELLIDLSSNINNLRNNIALQSINPSFHVTANTGQDNYTMSPTDFQSAIIQQAANKQAIRNANRFTNRRRNIFNANNNNSTNTRYDHSSSGQFFQSDPSSQQGDQFNSNSNKNKIKCMFTIIYV